MEHIYLVERTRIESGETSTMKVGAFTSYLSAKACVNRHFGEDRKRIRQHFEDVKDRLQEEYSCLLKSISSSEGTQMDNDMEQLKCLSAELENIKELQLVSLVIDKKSDGEFSLTMSNDHLDWTCTMNVTKIQIFKD